MHRRFLSHADAEHLDEVHFPSQDLEDAALELGLHPLARGGFPDGGHRFKEKKKNNMLYGS